MVITAKPVTESIQIGRDQAVPGDVLLVASLAPGVADVSTSGRLKVRDEPPGFQGRSMWHLRFEFDAAIEARPNQIRLLLQEGNTPGRTMLARVQHNLRGEFKVTGCDAVESRALPGDDRRWRHQDSRFTPWP